MEESVAGALLYGEGEAQILAARRLCKLKSKQRHELAKRGVIESLISMLHSNDCETTEAALCGLLSLASGSERNKIKIAMSGVIPVLLELLQPQTQSLFELAVAALLILSSSAANKLEIASSGAIQLLIEILNADHVDHNNDNYTNTISLQAKLDTIATLHNLSTCPQIMPSIASSGSVTSLLRLIYSYEKSSELVEKAMALLERIVSSSEIVLKETVSTNGAMQSLVEALEEGSPTCKEHAVGVLVLIGRSCRDRYRGVILREGVMPGLLQLSVDGTRRAKEMAGELLLLLRDRSCHSSRSKQSQGVLLERVMQQIDADERVGTALRLVEETIAKLSS